MVTGGRRSDLALTGRGSDRRALIRKAASLAALGLLSSCDPGSRVLPSATPRPRRIGFLGSDTPGSGVEGFRRAMRELDYVEGRDFTIEFRFAQSVPDRLPGLAAELIDLRVDVLFVIGGLLPARAAKQATTTVPIVFTNLEDPVEQGIVRDLARPGGNVTGMTGAPGVIVKRLELLKETVPGLARVVLFGNRNQPGFSIRLRELAEAGRALAVEAILPVGIDTLDELEGALGAIERERPDALMVVQTFRFFSARPGSLPRLIEFVSEHRLPQTFDDPDYVRTAGGLMGLRPSDAARWRIVARLIDKILRGADPGDLPVELNSVYDIVLNLSMARKIGLTFPESVLRQATEVIQ